MPAFAIPPPPGLGAVARRTAKKVALEGLVGLAVGKAMNGLKQAQKRRKPKAAPKQEAKKGKKKSDRRIGTGGCMFDPTCTKVPGTLFPCSDAVLLRNQWKGSETITSTNAVIYCFAITGSSATIGFRITNATPPALTAVNFNYGATASSTTGPYEGKPCRFGVSLMNYTARLNRGGSLYYLVTDMKLPAPVASITPSTWTAANVDTLAGYLKSSGKSTRVGLDEFTKQHYVYTAPISQPTYDEFVPYASTETPDVFASRIFETSGAATERLVPMTMVWMLFDAPAESQTLALSAEGAHWLRYPTTDAMSQMAKPVPVQAQSTLADHAMIARVEGTHFRLVPAKGFDH